MNRGAVLSRCGKYRYLLTRVWDADLPAMVFVMLNPSTADDLTDDPTIRRCVSFAKREGCGSIEVVNLFAFRSTDPYKLYKLTRAEAVGPQNDRAIEHAAYRRARRGGLIIAAWGAHGGVHERAGQVASTLRSFGALCLGKTKEGHPRHPLYLSGRTRLEPL